jgi:glycosyltransferase involved in cell wall biosynthesis
MISSLGLQEKVLLLGYVAREDMPVLLSGADALVFPSLHEGFGLPVVEAFACGCPVITSDCSSLPEVAGRDALLVPPLEIEGIAQAMERMARDTRLRRELGRRGLLRAKLFTWERTARKTLEVFRLAAGKGRRMA